ncbi:MAG TPA: restriction endonuclease, SacI family [Candidatus Binataceae bacterium]|jgi:hypothetical protein|nr:restriction endonuclease, SacI family [Candidatus Binataceae bacterium]
MQINRAEAAELLRKQASIRDPGDRIWIHKVQQLSQLCEDGISKTHIAFLGTVLLAKAMDPRADLFAIKPAHAIGKHKINSFSARTLCHNVLVPIAAELGISLGVTGREPLNNQPYFRMTRLGDGTPVHAGGRKAFDYMIELVKELQQVPNVQEARKALRAFISVRRRYQPRYADPKGDTAVTPEQLLAAIIQLVSSNSEGGRRAQAVAAGLLDIFAGLDRVLSGRINDPSRKYPGDVCIKSATDPHAWEKAFEVRDKPVSTPDIQIFGKKCVDMRVREAAVVMVSDRQIPVDEVYLAKWASGFGLGLTLFFGWESFVDQVLFWSELPKPIAATRAVACIRQRLINVECSPAAVALWNKLTRAHT